MGIPHPFDSFRGSLSRGGQLAEIAPLVDWIEGHNARLVGRGNEQAAAFAPEHAKPVVAVSDAHSLMEIGVAYSALDGDPSTPERPARRAGRAPSSSQVEPRTSSAS